MKKKVIFEISLIIWFICIILNFLLSAYYSYVVYKNSNLQGMIAMLTSLLVAYALFILYINNQIHENGHRIIYLILGEESKIYKIKILHWRIDPENGSFNDELKENNPSAYLILCLAGVIMSTIASLILSFIMNIIFILTTFNIKIIYFFGCFSVVTFAYNIVLMMEFVSNLWSKKIVTDGYKARSIFN